MDSNQCGIVALTSRVHDPEQISATSNASQRESPFSSETDQWLLNHDALDVSKFASSLPPAPQSRLHSDCSENLLDLFNSQTLGAPPLKRSKTTHIPRHHPQSATHMNRSRSSAQALSPHAVHTQSINTSTTHVTPYAPKAALTIPKMTPHRLVNSIQDITTVRPSNLNHDTAMSKQNFEKNQFAFPLAENDTNDIYLDPSQFLFSRGCYDSVPGLTHTSSCVLPPFSGPATSHGSAAPASSASGLSSTSGSLPENITFTTAMTSHYSEEFPGRFPASFDVMQADSCGTFSTHVQRHSSSINFNATNDPVDLIGSDEDVRGVGSKYSLPMHAFSAIMRSGSATSQYVPSDTENSSAMALSSSRSIAESALGKSMATSTSNDEKFDAYMVRSISNSSVRSNQSLRMRAQHSLRRQLDNATKTILQPKGPALSDTAITVSRNPNPQQNPPISASCVIFEGQTQDGKKEISKTTYVRPIRAKLKCDLCNTCPDGFRGEHELRRHKSAKHSTVAKKYICRDPRDDDIYSTVVAINPLSNCKKCRHKKEYSAYYNAAEHLRRAHFKIKPRKGVTRNLDISSNRNENPVDWPPMQELRKNWLLEVSGSAVADLSGLDDLADNTPSLSGDASKAIFHLADNVPVDVTADVLDGMESLLDTGFISVGGPDMIPVNGDYSHTSNPSNNSVGSIIPSSYDLISPVGFSGALKLQTGLDNLFAHNSRHDKGTQAVFDENFVGFGQMFLHDSPEFDFSMSFSSEEKNAV